MGADPTTGACRRGSLKVHHKGRVKGLQTSLTRQGMVSPTRGKDLLGQVWCNQPERGLVQPARAWRPARGKSPRRTRPGIASLEQKGMVCTSLGMEASPEENPPRL